jgi:hypothetical protein
VDDFYENSIQILDFYPAVEKLGHYAALVYKNNKTTTDMRKTVEVRNLIAFIG